MNHNWIIAKGSILGSSHTEKGQGCQDSFYQISINEDWGVAVVCDGAGSYDFSQIGSAYVAEGACKALRNMIFAKGILFQNELPDQRTWREYALKTLEGVQTRLIEFSKRRRIKFEDLSCTVIAVIYGPIGLLTVHIGDGRGAYSTDNENWEVFMKPYIGKVQGATVFITQNVFEFEPEIHIESRVINTPVKSFALMSDGCEKASYHLIDEKAEIKEDLNIPSEDFFTPNVESLHKIYLQGLTPSQINARWIKYLEVGTEKLKVETDDKTMLLITRKPCTKTKQEIE